jgi:RNA polymerase sigma-70 factor (ECF subfamily)
LAPKGKAACPQGQYRSGNPGVTVNTVNKVINIDLGEMIMQTQAIAKHEVSSRRACWSIGCTDRRETSDEALVKSIEEGDKRAIRILFTRHNVLVYRFALRLVHDESAAEDLVSEVFFDAWRQAGKFEGRSRVATWLLGIARNKAHAMLRRRSETRLDEKWATTIEDPADDQAVSIEKNERGAILRKCLKRLSVAHREIIDLVYYHEKSIDEVAEIISMPRNTVKTRMHYARLRMAKLVADAGLDRASMRL